MKLKSVLIDLSHIDHSLIKDIQSIYAYFDLDEQNKLEELKRIFDESKCKKSASLYKLNDKIISILNVIMFNIFGFKTSEEIIKKGIYIKTRYKDLYKIMIKSFKESDKKKIKLVNLIKNDLSKFSVGNATEDNLIILLLDFMNNEIYPVKDILGVRIITLYDQEKIFKTINDKIYFPNIIKHLDRPGNNSTMGFKGNYLVPKLDTTTLKVGIIKKHINNNLGIKFKDFNFEIQILTPFMEFFSEIEHDYFYKFGKSHTDEKVRAKNLIYAICEHIDNNLETLFNK